MNAEGPDRAVKSLGYVVFETVDIAKWRTFATDVLGLMAGADRGEDMLLFRMDDRPFRLIVQKGERDGFIAAGWELPDETSYRAALSRLRAAGVALTETTAAEAAGRCVKALARCQDPSGNGVELHWGRMVDYLPFVSPVGVSGFVTGDLGLGHVVLPTTDLAATSAFYKDLLGFADTDYIRVLFTPDPEGPAAQVLFMHCDNSRHHSLALTDMAQPSGAVHIMLEAQTLDDVGYALERVKKSGAHLSASLGRHTNDRMVSFYVRTPGGFDIEFGCNGWQVDWSDYVPTISLKDSAWGHEWNFGGPPA